MGLDGVHLFKFYLHNEYLSQLNCFGPPNCTYHRTLGAVRRTAPIIIGMYLRNCDILGGDVTLLKFALNNVVCLTVSCL